MMLRTLWRLFRTAMPHRIRYDNAPESARAAALLSANYVGTGPDDELLSQSLWVAQDYNAQHAAKSPAWIAAVQQDRHRESSGHPDRRSVPTTAAAILHAAALLDLAESMSHVVTTGDEATRVRTVLADVREDAAKLEAQMAKKVELYGHRF